MSWQQPEGQSQPQQPEWGSAQPQTPQPAQFGAPQQAPFGSAPTQPQPAQFGAPQPGQPTPPPFYTPHPYEKKRSGFGTRQIVSLVVIVVIAGIAFAVHAATSKPAAQRNSNGTVTKAGTVGVTDLKVGDCFNGASVGATDLSSVTAVPCTQAHSGQVLGSVAMTDTSYPSDSALDTEANSDCNSYFSALPTTGLPSDASPAYLAPATADDFNQGDTTITCVLQSTTEDLNKSYASN